MNCLKQSAVTFESISGQSWMQQHNHVGNGLEQAAGNAGVSLKAML